MEFHPGRILGIILGLVILVTIFVVPFGSANTTLYGVVNPKLSTLQSGSASDIAYNYVLVIAFILLVIAGVVGLFPLGTGVLGVVGMAMITVAPSLIYPNGNSNGNVVGMGAGFYVIWIASIASLGASFWHRKKQPAAAPMTVNVTQTQTMGETSTMQEAKLDVKCPNCGTMNASGAVQCSNCGAQLTKET